MFWKKKKEEQKIEVKETKEVKKEAPPRERIKICTFIDSSMQGFSTGKNYIYQESNGSFKVFINKEKSRDFSEKEFKRCFRLIA